MFDVYKIGITISLASNVAQMLGVMGNQFGRTEAKAKQLQATLKNIAVLGAGGAALTGLGLGILKSMDAPYQAAKRYEMALNRFQALNLGDVINSDADRFARGAKMIGVTAKDVITNLTDMHTVFGDFEHAKAFTPTMSKMLFANHAIFGDEAKFTTKQAGDLGRAIEMRGGFKSVDEMLLQADMAQRVLTATAGRVMPSDMLSVTKTGGVAASLLSNKAFWFGLEPLVQEMSGNRVGTALMSAYQNVIQGRTTNRAAGEMMKLGLLDRNKVEYDKIGNVKRVLPGGLKGSDLYTQDPFEWMKSVLLPTLEAKGITKERDIINTIGSIFTNRTGANLFVQMFRQREKIEKNMRVSENAEGIDALHRRALTSPAGREVALTAALENMKAAWGRSLMPLVLDGLVAVTKALNVMGDFAEKYPTAAKWITGVAIGVGVLATVFGTVALVAAGIVALGAIGVTGVGVAIGAALVAVGAAVVYFWDEIKGIAVASWEGVKTAWHSVVSTVSAAVDWIMSLPAKVANSAIGRFLGLDDNAGARGKTLADIAANQPTSDIMSGLPMGPGAAPMAPGAPPARADGAIDLAAYRAAQASQPVQVNSSIYLDGRKVAQAVTHHQAREANGPLASTTSFDTRRDYTPTVTTAR